MTPKNALNILYQAARLAQLSAPDHEKIAEAAKVLNELINPKKEEKKGK
jgi:hypothetical protein